MRFPGSSVSRFLAELERARDELLDRGAEVLAVPCDVTDPEQVERMVQAVRHRFGQIDVLINNAGAIAVGPMEVMKFEDYETAMKIHFWAPLYATSAVLPEMRQRHEGRIVNISSIGGKVSVPHMLPYSSSKFALVGFSELPGKRTGSSVSRYLRIACGASERRNRCHHHLPGFNTYRQPL